jgi:cytochrome c biogenesis protein CcmG/thiol:disulfide interchange protein DsbE
MSSDTDIRTFSLPKVQRWHRINSSQFALAALLLCSVAINVMLAWRVGQLKNAITHMKSEGRLAEGTSLPSIAAIGLDNTPVTITYSENGLPTVLYVFTPGCSWCLRNLPNIKALAEHGRNEYRFIGLSLSEDNLREYVAHQNFNFPIYSGISHEAVKAYRLSGTPQTIILSPEGRVLKTWSGAYIEDVQKEVEAYFQVHLPGISEIKNKETSTKECTECGEQPQPRAKSQP